MHFNNNGFQDSSQAPGNSGLNAALQHLFASIQDSIGRVPDIQQYFEQFNLPIGEEILNVVDDSPASSAPQKQSDLYLIIKGKGRVLGFDPMHHQEVSALSLEAGDTFGFDRLLHRHPLPYRVVSATPVQIARLPWRHLQKCLESIPKFKHHLQQIVLQQQILLFFKTLTRLRAIPSHRLQQLLPLVIPERIAKGVILKQATPGDSGHFWLQQGHIQTSKPSSSNPQPMTEWGYPNPTPDHWIAATELQIYRLPREQWNVATAIIPELDPGLPAPSKHPTHIRVQRERLTTNSVAQQSHSQGSGVLTQRSPHHNYSHHNHSHHNHSHHTHSHHTHSHHSASTYANGNSSTITSHQDEAQSAFFPHPKKRRRRQFWKGYPFIQQQSAADCGVACLAMIAQYWGKRPSLNTLRDLADVGKAGTSLKRLAKASEAIGFQARPVRASLDALIPQTNPWIAYWQGNHYVVVYKATKRSVVIADPALGKRTLSPRELQANWSGHALLLEPTELLQSFNDKQPGTFSKLLNLLKFYRFQLGQVVVTSLLIQVFSLVTPLFTQVILDRVVVQKSILTLHVFALGLVFFGVWKVGLTAVRQYLLDFLSNRLDLTLMSGFVSHALLLPLTFFSTRHVGDITTRVQESQKLQRFLTRQVIISWLDASMAFVYVGLMFYYNAKLALLVLGLIPPIVLLTLAATPMLRKVSREVFNSTAKENSALVEMITGIATVKANAVEREIRWQWEDYLTSMLNSRFGGQKLANNLQVLSGLINTLGSTALLWYGAQLVIQDQLTIGQFVAFNMLIGQVINPILSVVHLWDEYQEAVISVERLNDVLSTQPEENIQHSMMAMPSLQGDVCFEQVTFRYIADQERNTLENLSFKAEPGQTIALVGRSGSGKSTFVNLLQGLYYPDKGRISIDGHDIRHVSPQSLRSQLGVVPQDCFLFSGTILDNITLHRTRCSLDDVIEVSRLAEAHSFIQALPLGYHTKVGERGTTLSGGQRQRIAIARALLCDPRILILDEATSSLDTESERRFQQNLYQFSRDRTTFIIAHRLSTVRYADCILVLDRGILVEQGTHEQLMEQHGLYYHLAHQQLNL